MVSIIELDEDDGDQVQGLKKQSSYIDNYNKKYNDRVRSTKTYSFYFNDNYINP